MNPIALLDRVPLAAAQLLARIGIAGTFFRSGQTKIDGPELLFGIKWPAEITAGALFLFEEEYAVPLLPGDVAALLATFAEHLFPVLLLIGLASRLSALALLGMTAVIQLFVYPGLWIDHALWAAALVLIAIRGAGPLSVDRVLVPLVPARLKM